MELILTDLTKEFGTFVAVDHINLTMTKGVYGLLGVNGAGKTTLMRMICTLLKPTNGSITCDGKDIFRMGGEYRSLLGYLPQDFGCKSRRTHPPRLRKSYGSYEMILGAIRRPCFLSSPPCFSKTAMIY